MMNVTDNLDERGFKRLNHFYIHFGNIYGLLYLPVSIIWIYSTQKSTEYAGPKDLIAARNGPRWTTRLTRGPSVTDTNTWLSHIFLSWWPSLLRRGGRGHYIFSTLALYNLLQGIWSWVRRKIELILTTCLGWMGEAGVYIYNSREWNGILSAIVFIRSKY